MAVSYMDYTSPSVQFTYDLSDNLYYQKDQRNYILALSIQQLNTLGNVSILDIYLSKGNVVEPHYHQNASELVYCVSGAAVVSLINPFTKELRHFPIRPRQVANVPQGWWHYEIATEDHTQLLAVFDAPIPEIITGSDLLRLTPANVLAHTYCLNEPQLKEVLAPITDTVIIGPPSDCKTDAVQGLTGSHPAKANSANLANSAIPSYPPYPVHPATGHSANPAYPFPGYYGQTHGRPAEYSQQPGVGNGWGHWY